MDQTILFAFPRHSDFGRMASGSDVRAAALDPANVERLVEADPDDLGRELNFIAGRLISDASPISPLLPVSFSFFFLHDL